MTYLIGLDCGGTHTVGQLWNKDNDTLVSEVINGPGNVIVDYDAALENIKNTIQELLNKNDSISVDLILLGIAGIESSEKINGVISVLTKIFNTRIEVMSDAKLALLNGLRGNDGSLIISGTGSIIYGRQNNKFYRVGGWGYILGDEGSAYDIAKNALIQILERLDNKEPSLLKEPIFNAMQVKNGNEAIAKFYATSRSDNAQLALVVAKEADQHNLDAIDIIDSSARKLSIQAITLLKNYDKPIPTKVALSGSVLKNNKLFNSKLRNYISQTFNNLEFTDTDSNNAHGVVYFDKWN